MTFAVLLLLAAPPPEVDFCGRLAHDVRGRKHGFLAGNLTYYVGGFHASWRPVEEETLGLTHPFRHDLRSRGVGLLRSEGTGPDDTGTGNDFLGWEFYKDTRVAYGSVVVDGRTHRHPVPTRMVWRPDRMECEYEVAGVRLRERKFVSLGDAACSLITSSKPVTLRLEGRSFLGRHSVRSTAAARHDAARNAVLIAEGGTTRSRPETDRRDRVGPMMVSGQHVVLAADRPFDSPPEIATGDAGEAEYAFEVPCDGRGVAIVWATDETPEAAWSAASDVLEDPEAALAAKTAAVNRLLNEQVPRFRCPDPRVGRIFEYLWALYLMYDIRVGRGWETDAHTQTAVNNFLGMHRYDAAFQIRVGAWTADKPRYAYGNVLTWKRLFEAGQFRRSGNGVVALADTKGVAWHSGVYGNELSEHVLAAWQVYRHTGDTAFLRDCYEGYFREVFWEAIAPFFSNHFEVARVLEETARLTGHAEDAEHWRSLVPQDDASIDHWFTQRWQAHGHADLFAGPADGPITTTPFWHLRSPHFPREYARRMTDAWLLDAEDGFLGPIPPLAMARRSMRVYAGEADLAFGSTPDTAYFTLDGLFRQGLRDEAARLTLRHLLAYNWQAEWGVPVAPEAYRRDGRLFGDQYSNFNAGKLLLVLEGLCGLRVDVPADTLTVREAMPAEWDAMEVAFPLSLRGESEPRWPTVRYARTAHGVDVRVSDCPLRVEVVPRD